MSDMEEETDMMTEKNKDIVKGKEKTTTRGKKFEVKKWNAVALWAWGNADVLFFAHLVCAICRNHGPLY